MRFLEWLLGLEGIRIGRDAPLTLKWVGPLPAWALFCAVLVILVVVVIIYRGERVPIAKRVILAINRLALFGLILMVLCQPTLVWQRVRVEPSYISLLIDTSLSMSAQEPYADPSYAEATSAGAGLESVDAIAETSRLDLVKNALLRDGRAPLAALVAKNTLQLATFAGSVEPLARADSPESLTRMTARLVEVRADGLQTDLAGAITHEIERARGRRLAALVIATDGQSTEPTRMGDAIDLARGRQIPIYALRIGSTQRPRDIEIGPLRADEVVFAKDLVAIEARVTGRGITGPTRITVQLIDEGTDTILATREVELTPDQHTAQVELTTKSAGTGRVRYRVEALPIDGERTLDNNSDTVDLRILDDQVKVLYVDGYPRYEYRFLKNALLREPTAEVGVLLIEADEDFVQEGAHAIRRFPDTPEELNRYDVLLFGDVDPRGGWLTSAQMNMILDFVGNQGGGFGLIAGERFAPQRFLGTPLEKLIPVVIDPEFLGRYDHPLATGFKPVLTFEGKQSRVFRWDVGEPTHVTTEDARHDLPQIFWMARTLGAKPGATVLAHHPTWQALSNDRSGVESMPLIVTGRYGAGRVFFQASDDTWRWRREAGEMRHDAYWIQVVRELMRTDRFSQGRRMILRTDRRRYAYGTPVRVQLEIVDPALIDVAPDRLSVTIGRLAKAAPFSARGESTTAKDRIDVVGRCPLHRIGRQFQLYEGSFIPAKPGGYNIAMEAFHTGSAPPSAAFRVERPDREGRRPEADHAVLARMTEATGGRLIELNELVEAFGAIPDRSIQIPDDVSEPLWDSRLFLILLTGLISLEWILRKAFGLV